MQPASRLASVMRNLCLTPSACHILAQGQSVIGGIVVYLAGGRISRYPAAWVSIVDSWISRVGGLGYGKRDGYEEEISGEHFDDAM